MSRALPWYAILLIFAVRTSLSLALASSVFFAATAVAMASERGGNTRQAPANEIRGGSDLSCRTPCISAGFMAGWFARTGEEWIGAASGPAPIGGWIAVGSPTLEVEAQALSANDLVQRGTHEQDTVLNLTAVKFFQTSTPVQPYVLGGIGFILANQSDSNIPRALVNRGWTPVVGAGIRVGISRHLIGRFGYRLNFSEATGAQQFLAGIGAVF